MERHTVARGRYYLLDDLCRIFHPRQIIHKRPLFMFIEKKREKRRRKKKQIITIGFTHLQSGCCQRQREGF